jgi:O-antigen/teichoic acid export membrane protein
MTPIQPEGDILSRRSSTLRGRLMRGFSATALSPVVTAVVQLVSVPVLLHAWGAAKYGDWLLLSAIPSYLTLSDLGFGNASGSDMSMRVAAGDRKGALETFQSSWVLVTITSFTALLLASVAVWRVPWQRWLRLTTTSNLNAAEIILVFCAYVIAAQQNGVAESGYRCDGHFAAGAFWNTMQRLCEAVAGTTVAVMDGSLLAVALTYLGARCVGSLGYALLLRHKSPWLRYGVRHAKLTTIRKMVAPALGFIALPAGTALSLQGFTIVVGASMGPVAVVSFSTLRTLSRLTFQAVSVVTNALWPELSRAFGAGNISLARRLHRHACQASLGVSVLGGVLLWVFGPSIYHVWIRQKVPFDATCFHILLFVAAVNSLWNTSSVISMSVNGHCRIAAIYVGAAIASLGIAWVLIPPLGEAGAALALLAADSWMAAIALRTALRQVEDSHKKFLGALFVIPRLREPLQPATEA